MPGAREFLDQLDDDAALDAVVAHWRAGTLPKAAWAHAAHVAVSAWHAWPDLALASLVERMKAGISERVLPHQAGAPQDTRLAAVDSAVAALGDARTLHAEHYDFDVVRDPTARARWVPPGR